ncbi:MAG: hypothetical protein KDD60_03835, partial [Bdellovibrionales bacterium]|nr:hypothetical protein [Bdellovibrionales bacterium]
MMPLNRESLLRTANFVTHGIDLKDALSSTRALNRFPFISFLPSNSTINQMQQSSHSETLFRNLAPHGSDAEMSNRQFVAWIRDVASKESRFSYLCNRYLRDHLPIYAASETLTQAAHLVTSELPFLCSALNQSHPVLSLLTSHLYLQARGTKLGSFPEVMQEWYSDIATHTESALLCVESFFCTLRLRAGQPTELFGRFLSAWKSDIQTLILENLLHANTQALIAFYASDNFLVQMVGFPRPTTVSIEFIEAEISKFTRSYECFNFTPLERYADMLK